MDFSARKQSLEMRRSELEGILSGAAAVAPGAVSGTSGMARYTALGGALRKSAGERQDELHGINAALERLREGSYGYCRICGDNIADDWLDQRPESPFCKSCAL